MGLLFGSSLPNSGRIAIIMRMEAVNIERVSAETVNYYHLMAQDRKPAATCPVSKGDRMCLRSTG